MTFWFRARRNDQQLLLRWMEFLFTARAEGVEPSWYCFKGSWLTISPHPNAPSSGRRIRTFSSLLNRKMPYQFGYTGISKSGWSESNRRSRAPEARGFTKLSNTLSFRSVQRESNSHILLGKEAGYHYTMNAFLLAQPNCQRSDQASGFRLQASVIFLKPDA